MPFAERDGYNEYKKFDFETATKQEAIENEKHNKKMRKIWADLTNGMTEEQKEQLGVLYAMSVQTQMYGGELEEKSKGVVDAVTSVWDSLSSKTQKAFANATAPMLQEFEKVAPKLYKKADEICNGILTKMQRAFEEHSPSKATRRIFRYLWEGAEIGNDEEVPTLLQQTAKIGQSIIDAISDTLQSRKRLDIPFTASANLTGINTSAFVASAQKAVMNAQTRIFANAAANVTQTIINRLDTTKIADVVQQGLENANISMNGNVTAQVNLDGRKLAASQTPFVSQNIGKGVVKRRRCNT